MVKSIRVSFFRLAVFIASVVVTVHDISLGDFFTLKWTGSAGYMADCLLD